MAVYNQTNTILDTDTHTHTHTKPEQIKGIIELITCRFLSITL